MPVTRPTFLTCIFAAFVANGIAFAAETATKPLPRYTETDDYKKTFKAVETPGARPSLAGGAGEFIVRPPAAPAMDIANGNIAPLPSPDGRVCIAGTNNVTLLDART
ncbi:MAG: hypothetical protein WCL49_11385, partial [bacterium]